MPTGESDRLAPCSWTRRATLAIGLLAAVSLGAPSAAGQTFNTADFFTQQLGDYWIYRLNGAQLVALETVALVPIGGFTYQTSLWTGGPLDGLETTGRFNPGVGVELVSNFQPSIFIDGVGFVDQRQDFSPPALGAPPQISIGQIVQTSGALTQTYSNAIDTVVLPGTYSISYRLALIEPISVPFGSFDAIQRQIQLDLALQIGPSQWEEVRGTSRDWIVPGLGVVRLEQTFPGRIDVYELVDTNRQFVPEAESAVGILTATTTMAAIWLPRRRRRGGST